MTGVQTCALPIYPVQLADLVEDMKKLDAASLEHIAAIVKEMVGNK